MNENSVKISAVILTKNSEKTIEKCLKSLMWCDEVVVMDSFSIDRTLEIAKMYNCKIYQVEWKGFSEQRNIGAQKATNDWVFFVDSDEFVTEELANEIMNKLSTNKYYGYYVPMKNFMFGKWMKHCGLDMQIHLRLYNRKYGRWTKDIHETVQLEGQVGYLKNPLLHYAYPTINSLVVKVNRYTDLEAMELYKKGERFNFLNMTIESIGIFIYKYLIQGGFLDGYNGLIWSISLSYYRFLKWMKLWELILSKKIDGWK